MQVIFNNPRRIGGRLYLKNKKPQEVPDSEMGHWFVKECAEDGSILCAGKLPDNHPEGKTPKSSRDMTPVERARAQMKAQAKAQQDSKTR
jgi:hypothetical protein